MKSKDLIFLIVALIAWIYSSYRSFQKQAAQKREEVKRQPVLQQETITNPDPFPISTPGRKIVRDPQQPSTLSTARASPSGSLEILTTDIKTSTGLFPKKRVVEKKEGIAKQVDESFKSPFKVDTSEDIVEEIINGKTDWRKAIVLSEILRPVYF